MTIQTEFNFPKDSFGYVPGAVPAKMVYSLTEPQSPVEGLWWVKAASTESSVEDIYFYTGAAWLYFGLGAGTVVSETQPQNPRQGMRWLNMSLPAIFVYYVDNDSGQWVEEAHEGIDGALRSDLQDVNSTVSIAGVQAKNLARKYNELVSIKDFGVLGIGNDKAVFQAAANACKTGKTLWLGDATIELGTLSAGEIGVLIDSPLNMQIIGSGATVKCTAVVGRSSMIGLKNPINFKSFGVNFENNGFTIAGTVGGPRIGSYGYYAYATAPYSATSPCGNIEIDGVARNCMGFVISDSTNQLGILSAAPYGVRGLKVTGSTSGVYYGVSSVYGATDVDVNLVCTDTRRGFISYGQRTAKVDLSLSCSAGFVGSDAFVEIACEGVTAGNVYDIDVNVSLTGVEGHEAIVNFYHQQNEAAGEIANVRSFISANNLTTVGKAGALGALNLYRFTHVNASGTILPTTDRATKDCRIDCSLVGSISGNITQVQSAPNAKHSLYLGGDVSNAQSDFGLWSLFNVRGASLSLPFTPVTYGETVAGTATYGTQKAMMSVSDGVASFSIVLSWTGHTGSGNMLIGSLPIKPKGVALLGNVAFCIQSENVGPANTLVTTAITGADLTTLTIYTSNLTSRSIGFAAVPANGYVSISGTYPV